MTTHFSFLAWKIPWTEKPDGLQSKGFQRVRHDWVCTHASLVSFIFLIKCELFISPSSHICWPEVSTILGMMWFSRITISPKKTSWNLGKLGRSSSTSSELSFLDLSKWLFFIIVFHIFPFRQFDELWLLCLLMTSLLKSKIKFRKMFTIGMSIMGAKTRLCVFYIQTSYENLASLCLYLQICEHICKMISVCGFKNKTVEAKPQPFLVQLTNHWVPCNWLTVSHQQNLLPLILTLCLYFFYFSWITASPWGHCLLNSSHKLWLCFLPHPS